ncbi:stage III sporulation protein SpoIIIAB [Ferdinandcohnia quinoae]|uniref:Stage III sporulation protein SpoAB n=1 Tax=Fredinandcohnia quinoae TaxID=2918902 RepID=A0AAW5E9Q2_9BACI|nr:stage III sporulation protein SpoIIIAB [Fredinandcohnia sp. SECRCQ15]MCH1626617.1 stage III sporulation protein SpoAB [Fredinandcohnia sp. SECRCQ15]
MIKILGAIFILLATTWAGFEAARHLSERPRQLRMLRTALQSLEAEIMYGHVPLIDVALHLSTQIPKPISWFFESFAKKLQEGEVSVKIAWEESLTKVSRLTAFKQGELEILKQFGETLGQHDRSSQQKHIILALTHLDREESEARDRQLRYEKMVKSLGFLSGLLLVILLM